jgi:hypothetical protein
MTFPCGLFVVCHPSIIRPSSAGVHPGAAMIETLPVVFTQQINVLQNEI